MDSVSVDGAELTINGTTVTFEFEIGEAIGLDEVIVIRLKVPKGEIHNQNVVAVDETGSKCWTIPECPRGSAEDKPYMNIYLREGEVRAWNWLGHDFRVDPATGALSDREEYR